MTKAWLQGLAVAIGLFGVSLSVLAATLNYSVYNNASGDIYLKAPAKFILIHSDVNVPLKIMPANGYMKLMLQPDGKWALSIITAAEWNQLSLQLATDQIAAVNETDLNGDGLADYSINLSSPQRVFSFFRQPTGGYTSVVTEAATPSISPSAGTYNGSVQVSLTTPTLGAVIRYTTNGADVTSSSQLYSGSFRLVTSSAVKAKSFKAGMGDSGQVSVEYIVAVASPESVTQYEYDARGRLVKVQDNQSKSSTYVLDHAGNRLSVSDQTTPALAPTITSLVAPRTVSPGGTATISWTSRDSLFCALAIFGDYTTYPNLPANGSVSLQLYESTGITLSCYYGSLSAVAGKNIRVTSLD
jgi:YD repeat-containing protein